MTLSPSLECYKDPQQKAESGSFMKGPAVMVGKLHGGLRQSQEVVPGLGFSRVLMRVRTPGHCERDSTHLLGGE